MARIAPDSLLLKPGFSASLIRRVQDVSNRPVFAPQCSPRDRAHADAALQEAFHRVCARERIHPR